MSEKHLFLDVYNEYLLYANKKQKEQSFVSLKYKFNSHILPFFKDMYLEDISSKNVLSWEEYSHTDLTQEKRVLSTLNSTRFNFFATLIRKFKSIIKRFSPF